MKVIGLTGGIGTGKSTVSQYLREKGYSIIDADQLAREVVEPGMPALAQLADRFGCEILRSDGSLDRRRLAQLAFATPEGKGDLDRITHGAIQQRICQLRKEFAQEHGADPQALLFLDIPLLFESGMEGETDQVWVVDAPEETRMERIRQRDGWTEDEIRARMRNQMKREDRIARADAVLDNSGVQAELYPQIDRLLAQAGGTL